MTGFEVGLYHDDRHGTALEISRRQVVTSADLGCEVPPTLDSICRIPDTTDVLGYFMGEIDIIFERKALRNCSKADLARMGEFHMNLAALYLVEGEFLCGAGLPDAMEERIHEFRSGVRDRLRSKIADLGNGAKESEAG